LAIASNAACEIAKRLAGLIEQFGTNMAFADLTGGARRRGERFEQLSYATAGRPPGKPGKTARAACGERTNPKQLIRRQNDSQFAAESQLQE
jgi:hypothetical protein